MHTVQYVPIYPLPPRGIEEESHSEPSGLNKDLKTEIEENNANIKNK